MLSALNSETAIIVGFCSAAIFPRLAGLNLRQTDPQERLSNRQVISQDLSDEEGAFNCLKQKTFQPQSKRSENREQGRILVNSAAVEIPRFQQARREEPL